MRRYCYEVGCGLVFVPVGGGGKEEGGGEAEDAEEKMKEVRMCEERKTRQCARSGSAANSTSRRFASR